jgi:NAD(P)-dependent dehydrogenase (short-subunit alcohol dehydrogenase family)
VTPNKPVAIVTGASSGIGKAAALALVDAGLTVVGTSRNTSAIAADKAVSFLDLDVTSDTSVDTLVRQVHERYGRIDVLVNNAGVGTIGAAEESSIAQNQHMFNINVFGVMRMTKTVLPYMRAQGHGRIINVSSVVGFLPSPYMAAYSASKHAIEGYTESLDHEVREYGIRALLVQPAYTNTGFESNSPRTDTPLQVYADQREAFGLMVEAAVKNGDDPTAVAKVIVTAATDPTPKLRYTAGTVAGRAKTLKRIAPARVFDKQIRKLNRLTD